ncbi:MAG: hypothetical protein OXG88_03685 [Gammaproteobacteria bacterium]|nr:hypothetical protein [Gammaproteobacteria bacterium]
MNLHGSRLNSFLKEIGAAAVCGYTKDVWWTESAAFELLFLSSVQEWTLARHDLLKGYRQGLRNVAPGLHRRLGFRMIVRQPKSKQPK